MRTYHFCVLNALQPNVMRQVKYKRRTSPLIKARIYQLSYLKIRIQQESLKLL